MKHPYYYSGTQLTRGLVVINQGREVDPFLRMAIAEMPGVKTPVEIEGSERLRRELR